MFPFLVPNEKIQARLGGVDKVAPERLAAMH